jgi:hypothetical protein
MAGNNGGPWGGGGGPGGNDDDDRGNGGRRPDEGQQIPEIDELIRKGQAMGQTSLAGLLLLGALPHCLWLGSWRRSIRSSRPSRVLS